MKARPVPHSTSRRTFLRQAGWATAAPVLLASSFLSLKALGYRSPNEKWNLAAIGAGGQPFGDLRNAHAGVENVVALADVDWKRGAAGFAAFPKARKYKDFREMLDQSGKERDAVIVRPPDHMHTLCALACMQLGKHVYVETPLTRTPWEARLLVDAAAKYNVATQMGNQGYSHDATRVACEIIWAGEIGEVREVHARTGRPSWPQGMTKIPPPTPVPETLDWDLRLGGAEARPCESPGRASGSRLEKPDRAGTLHRERPATPGLRGDAGPAGKDRIHPSGACRSLQQPGPGSL